jgi:hypothetical protein
MLHDHPVIGTLGPVNHPTTSMTDGTGQGAFDRDDVFALGRELRLQDSNIGNVERDRNLGGRHGFTSRRI